MTASQKPVRVGPESSNTGYVDPLREKAMMLQIPLRVWFLVLETSHIGYIGPSGIVCGQLLNVLLGFKGSPSLVELGTCSDLGAFEDGCHGMGLLLRVRCNGRNQKL